MNEYGQDLDFDLVLPQLRYVSAKQVLMEFSRLAAHSLRLSENLLHEQLLKREEETGSGIGDGVAVSHLQVKGPQRKFSILATLKREIPFQSSDDFPVSIVAFLLSPEKDGPLHLRRLSRISRVLKNEKIRGLLIEAKEEAAIRSLLIDPEGWMLAA